MLLSEVLYKHDPDCMQPQSIGVGGVTVHQFNVFHDPRGDLCVGTFVKDIPFVPKRYFLVYSVPEKKVRGEHAHYDCHQFLICVKGQCSLVLDDGTEKAQLCLDKASLGVYVPPYIWGTTLDYSEDAVLLVFCSDEYSEADYIRDYAQFCALVKNR